MECPITLRKFALTRPENALVPYLRARHHRERKLKREILDDVSSIVAAGTPCIPRLTCTDGKSETGRTFCASNAVDSASGRHEVAPELHHQLTRSQKALWASRLLRPDDPTGNRVMKVEWRLRLDPDAFVRALDGLVAGTDSLRLVFSEIDEEPWQMAVPRIDVDLDVRDFSAEVDPFVAANRWLDERSRQILDLTRRCFDTSLARLGPDRWIWYLNQHHIATDFVSASLLVSRLSELYCRALVDDLGAPPRFPSFLEFLDSHPEIVDVAARTSPRSHDKEQPTVRQGRRPRLYGAEDEAGSIVRHVVPLDGARLAKARARGALFNVLSTAFVAYVARASGRREVTFGALSHNRYHPDAAEVAGLFVRILPLHVAVGDGWSLNDLSAAVRRERRAVFSAAKSGRDIPARRYDVALNFVPDALPDFCGVPSLEIPPPEIVEASGRDLRLSVRAGANEASLRLVFDFDRRVAEAAGSVQSAAKQFLRVLDTFLDTPETAIEATSLAGPAERAAAIEAAAKAADAPPPPFTTLVDAFLARAAEKPQALALSQGDMSMSYAELEQASARVAGALVRRGIGPGGTVAVLVPRSMRLVVALLGVMRSGAAFCASEPWTPQERARLVIKDTDARLILTSNEVAESQAIWARERLDIEDLLETPDEAASLPSIDPRATLYYIHTSGTTGTPKGVVVSHESFARFTHWNHATILRGRCVVFALTTSITFDASLRCLTALWSGGSIRVVPEGDLVGEMGLTCALEEDMAATVMTTPSQLRLVVDRPWNLTRLQTLIVLGETLPRTLAHDAVCAFGPNVEIVNCYGPTEAILASTFHRIDPARDAPKEVTAATGSVPIGRPAPDVAVHVLDSNLNPMPKGISGEIFIGGMRLSDGYLNQPELTAEKFVDDPFWSGGKLYRTGDLGRVDKDENLVHLGRIDEQIKINGIRIEPGEAERAVAGHPRVKACAVDKRGSDPGRLVGWYVADEDIAPGELRAAASRYVYSASIPSLFQRVEEIPLSANGKIDRGALPDPIPPLIIGSDASREALPNDPVEAGIAVIWSRLLGVETLAPNDDFFDLGGDSLSAIHMVHLVESHFGVTFDAKSLEQIATVARLATLVRNSQARSVSANIGTQVFEPGSPADPRSIDSEVFRRLRILMAGWKGETVDPEGLIYRANSSGTRPPLLWCFNTQPEFEQMGRQLGADQPLYAMRSLQGVLPPGSDKYRQGMLMAEWYAARLLAAVPDGPCAVGGNCQAARIAMHLARALSDAGRSVAVLCLLERAPPIPYPGRVALFFGRDSESHNAFKRFAQPQIGWRRLYREVVWDVVPGSHGHYFEEPNIGPFCDRIADRMAEAWQTAPLRLPDSALAAAFETLAPIAPFCTDEPRAIEIAVRNESDMTWRPGHESGMCLANRWYPTRDDFSAIRLDGTTPLPVPLAPGETCALRLEIRAPEQAGDWILQIELCEEGIAWSSDRGFAPLKIDVAVAENIGSSDAFEAPAESHATPAVPEMPADIVPEPGANAKDLLEAGRDAARLGRDEMASRLLRGAADNAVTVFRELGECRLRTASPEAAVFAFETALRLRPDDRQSAIGLSSALQQLGQDRRALRILKRVDAAAYRALRRKLRSEGLVKRVFRRVSAIRGYGRKLGH